MNKCAALALTALLSQVHAAPTLDPDVVGVWQNYGDTLELSFLPDGRVFVLNTQSSSKVAAQPGTWQIQNHKLAFNWLVSGPEPLDYGVTGDGMTLAGWIELRRVGDAGDAANEYARQYAAAAANAQGWQKKYPVGKARPGNRDKDPHPERVNPGATVYAPPFVRFMDMTILDRAYVDPNNVNQSDQYQTFQAAEFFFYPNGRFVHSVTLPGGLDATFQPRYEMTTTWGRYSVKPGGALEGDTVSLQYDSGDTGTVKVLGGRRYLRADDILYLNQNPAPKPSQEGAPRG
ncbi:hypothetical protein [Deinococcus apachensis]|uniref:hypothetical protein n=1 Tax=Deinococcus apachensis TaxID=309886 RepID=UPI0003732D21|nr:hypothetical protein [Deinococcus apachensis]